jgi:serine/threonine protein phosphatase PrpC
MNIDNLGDCRAVIVYNDGSFKQVTTDHKPDDLIEKKRLKKMGGKIYKDSEGTVRIGDLSLSRAFGDEDNAPYISQIPDVYYKKITPQTKYIVMACDGLWDVIENFDLYNLLEQSNKKNNNLAVDLVEHALEKGSTDNISVLIILLTND